MNFLISFMFCNAEQGLPVAGGCSCLNFLLHLGHFVWLGAVVHSMVTGARHTPCQEYFHLNLKCQFLAASCYAVSPSMTKWQHQLYHCWLQCGKGLVLYLSHARKLGCNLSHNSTACQWSISTYSDFLGGICMVTALQAYCRPPRKR